MREKKKIQINLSKKKFESNAQQNPWYD